jgi:CubicO group peptidase (beta-lactamase class C family)
MFSSSKAVTAIALATVAQRGLLDYSARVADYWPDFAHNQKGELRQGDNSSYSGAKFQPVFLNF